MNPTQSYKDWQESWQKTGRTAQADHLDDLMSRLGKYTDHMKKRNRIKVTLIGLILAWQFIHFSLRPLPENPWPLFVGMGLVFLSTTVFLTFYLRGQFKLGHLDFSAPALQFVRQIIAALERERTLFRVHFPIFLLAMILGVNVLNIQYWPDQTLAAKALIHGLTSLALLLVGTVGWFYRRGLFRRKTGQLLVELHETQASWSRHE